ncbi:replication-associated recombination protein A [Intestinimonas butyriciproducens]|uniref:Putative ATPase n=1 Tax=Intestinimonas butyriciproducens TaxID=1297617 RepID=A0A2U1CEE5_9FIRM|nr:replication-associated recombination protein A [Intestinimonas butyriciproducens]SCI72075.1 Replication-associated recombination protein A [uncultured Clostridium sp.]MBU5229237.1 replication-associated recombination protein A [Intestinimonas butyriciproducens]MCI6362199.1 replication-associated recombination protein A [Intestinimonas butyriciproducens]MCR1905471.1 replication-associated recombination protein A [Intestinimonas butyriciproducens]MDB7816326.1 replication-associated recombinat
MAYRPLADEIRPTSLDDVVGQKHILGADGLLRRIIESGSIPNLVFYGPSGTGKTTVANIIAARTNRTLRRINATTGSLSDVKDVIGEVGTMMAPNGILLYLDEIQYFNKKQQQSLLEVIERGDVTLIASTTENPYFYVYNAVLSRSTVFEFKPVEAGEVLPAIDRGVSIMAKRLGGVAEFEDGVREAIASSCGGDVRKAMNAVELLMNAAARQRGKLVVSLEDARLVAQRSAMRYDRAGDDHYDILSALQKSIRGSDPDAACHYLARLLEAGDLISACRRLMVIACEDVGLAYPQVIPIVKACVDAANMLGLPEARIPLGDAAVLMATAPKSNSAHIALDEAMADVRTGKTGDYPRHLQNKHADSAGMEREQGYLYPHDFPNHYVKQQYLPDRLKGVHYYVYGENKTEQAAKRYWDEIKGKEEG